jgi:hypothetical protein
LLMLQQQGRQEPDQNPSGTSNKSGVCWKWDYFGMSTNLVSNSHKVPIIS